MGKWFRDVVLIPLIIGVSLMLWGAWYTGVRLHAPFSLQWLKGVLTAPVQVWVVAIFMTVSVFPGLLGYSSRRKFNDLLRESASAKHRWEPERREHDARLFRKGVEILPDVALTEMLHKLQIDDSYLSSESRRIGEFAYFFSQVGNQYIDPTLAEKLEEFRSTLSKLLAFLGANFFVYPEHQFPNDDLQHCLYPRLNEDRNGDCTAEAAVKYWEYQQKLDGFVKDVRRTHSDYRLAIKSYLYM